MFLKKIDINTDTRTNMGGHGHGTPYTVPHYSQFKIDGIPELEEVQRELAKRGLKDPWIR